MCIYLRSDTDKAVRTGTHVGQVTFRKMETYCFIASWGPALNPGPAISHPNARLWMDERRRLWRLDQMLLEWLCHSGPAPDLSRNNPLLHDKKTKKTTTHVQTISGHFQIRSAWFCFSVKTYREGWNLKLKAEKSFARWLSNEWNESSLTHPCVVPTHLTFFLLWNKREV